MMGLFSFLKRDKRHSNHNFSDEDREQATEIKRLNMEIRTLEKQKLAEEKRAELAEIKEELKAYKNGGYDKEEGGAEDYFLKMLMPIIASKFGGSVAQLQGQLPGPGAEEQGEELPPIQLSDEEIEGIIKNFIPKHLKILAKVLSIDNIKKVIMRYDQGLLSDGDIEKIARRLKG